MSLTIVPYLVATPLLQQVFGSANRRIINDLRETLAEDGKWDDDSVVQAVEDVVNGAPLNTQDADAYAAVLEILCMYFGVQLPHDAFESMRSPALQLLKQFEGLYNDLQLPLPIPESANFPTVYYINKQQAVKNLARLDPTLSGIEDNEGKRWAASALQQYRLWLQEAVDKKKDLYIFMY